MYAVKGVCEGILCFVFSTLSPFRTFPFVSYCHSHSLWLCVESEIQWQPSRANSIRIIQMPSLINEDDYNCINEADESLLQLVL